MSEPRRIGKWISALAMLGLLLFSASSDIGNSKVREHPLHPAVPGFGAPVQANEASNIAAAAGHTPWLTKRTKAPGSKKSVAILDSHKVRTHGLHITRSREFTRTTSHDSVTIRITSVRAPPATAFAI